MHVSKHSMWRFFAFTGFTGSDLNRALITSYATVKHNFRVTTAPKHINSTNGSYRTTAQHRAPVQKSSLLVLVILVNSVKVSLTVTCHGRRSWSSSSSWRTRQNQSHRHLWWTGNQVTNHTVSSVGKKKLYQGLSSLYIHTQKDVSTKLTISIRLLHHVLDLFKGEIYTQLFGNPLNINVWNFSLQG